MFGKETLSLGGHIALGLLVFEHIQINIFSDPFLSSFIHNFTKNPINIYFVCRRLED